MNWECGCGKSWPEIYDKCPVSEGGCSSLRTWSGTPKAPSPWHPILKLSPSDIRFHAKSGPADPELYAEFISMAEHTHLLAEAVREARAQAFEEAYRLITSGESSSSGLLVRAHRLREKASELRKGATPENGGKE